eukprot:m.120101 g.120101  ORF g.120101 m.120101 type:complete len:261 (+) comp37724_c0_seq4:86-868(+)
MSTSMDDFYDMTTILCREKFYGRGYSSTGGEDASKVLGGFLNAKQGSTVLDIGSGPGGFALYLAKSFQMNVIGIDLSSNMVKVAKDRLTEEYSDVADKVQFQLSDVQTIDFPAETFEAAFWRGSFLHIPSCEKEAVLQKMMTWLKPGGQFISMDHCLAGEVDDKEGFQIFSDKLGFSLITVKSYSEILKTAGLRDVTIMADNDFYLQKNVEEMADAENVRDEIEKLLGKEAYQSQVSYWLEKRKWTEVGAMNYVYVTAHK